MNGVINVSPVNHTYIKVFSTPEIEKAIYDYFTFDVPGAKYSAKYKKGFWDGTIKLYQKVHKTIYKGLLHRIKIFAKENNYLLNIDDSLIEEEVSNINFNVKDFISSLNLKIPPRDYQEWLIRDSIRDFRHLLVSSTGSGKSLVLYCILRWCLENIEGKILIVVPTTLLQEQMIGDFKDYSDFDMSPFIHQVYEGQEKESDKKIILSTWQSTYLQPQEYFEQFHAIIGDEAHGIAADSCTGIFEKSVNAFMRIGLTGTLKNTKTHKLTLEGLTGSVVQYKTTAEHIKDEELSELEVNCLIFEYPHDVRLKNKGMEFREECDFIQRCPIRNGKIANIAKNIKGENTLILTQYLDHIDLLKTYCEGYGKPVYIVKGETDIDQRDEVRRLAESQDGIIIIATYGTFKQGVNIKNLQNIIFATSSKSPIQVLQSIGRGLRRDGKKNKLRVFDIVDDFSYVKVKNYLFKHFFERVKIYHSQKFPFRTVKVPL